MACHAISWSNHKIADAIKDIAELGFEGIELPVEKLLFSDLNWNEISALLNDYNISIAAVYQTLRLGYNDDILSKYEFDRCMALLAVAKKTGIKYLILGDPPMAANNNCNRLAESLEKIGYFARSEGVRLCYHPHRGSIIERQEQIDRLLSLTSADRVSLCFDTGHILWGGGDPASLLRKYIDRIAYIHLKDIRKNHFSLLEISYELFKVMQMNRQRMDKLKYVGQRFLNRETPIITEIGKGDVDFEAIAESLYDLNYNGWITIELDAPTINPKVSLSRCLNKVNHYMTRYNKGRIN